MMTNLFKTKTLTLRLNDEKTLRALDFVRDHGEHKTDTKAIISALQTFEDDHNEFMRLRKELKFANYKISKYEAYFEMVDNLKSFEKAIKKNMKADSYDDLVFDLNPDGL